MLQKNFRFELKSLGEDGAFEGYASVFGVVDLDNEVVDKGAFKRTIDHNKGVVPILWQHQTQEPIGWNQVAEEDNHGLKVAGRLLLNTERGRQAYDFLKMGLEVGGKPGLSIGFLVPKDGAYFQNGQRHFKQVIWKEYSVVTYPCNEAAFVTGAKAEEVNPTLPTINARVNVCRAAREKDFNASLAEQQQMSALYTERCDLEAALRDAISEALSSDSLSKDEQKAEVAASLSQYATALSDWYGRMIDADTDNDTEEDSEEMSEGKAEKSGRQISSATADQLKVAMQHITEAAAFHAKAIGVLQILSSRAYTANDVNKPNPAGGGKSEEETIPEKKEDDSQELHSLLESLRSIEELLKK